MFVLDSRPQYIVEGTNGRKPSKIQSNKNHGGLLLASDSFKYWSLVSLHITGQNYGPENNVAHSEMDPLLQLIFMEIPHRVPAGQWDMGNPSIETPL